MHFSQNIIALTGDDTVQSNMSVKYDFTLRNQRV